MLLLGKPVLDGDILSFNPSKLAQLLPKRLQEDRDTGSSAIIQETYAEDFPCLLRLGRKQLRRKEHGAKSKDRDFFLHAFSLPRSTCHSTLDTRPFSLDHPIRPRQHLRRNRQADLLGCFEIDHQLELRRLLDRQSAGLAPFRILSTKYATRR